MNSKVEVAAAYILSNIKDAKWPVGAKLPSENELCGILNISRTSVRAAIQRYVAMGILESRHGKGTYVCTTDAEFVGNMNRAQDIMFRRKEFLQICLARGVAEPEVMAYAAEFATPELIMTLEECNMEMLVNIGNQKAFVAADMRFHKATVDFMENELISAYFANLLLNNPGNYIFNDVFGYYDGINLHMALLDAVKDRKAERARRLIIDHTRMQYEVVNKLEFFSKDGA